MPPDIIEYLALIQDMVAAPDTNSLQAAKERYGKRLRSERDKWLKPKTRAVLQYCVHDRANRDPTGNEIEVKHDPLEVLQKLAIFETLLRHPDQGVLLTGASVLKTSDTFLSGDVEYREGQYNFWEVWVKNNKVAVHMAAICSPYYDKESVEKAIRRRQPLDNVLVIGEEAIRAYAASNNSPVCPPKE